MSCIDVRYEKQFIISSGVRVGRFIFNKNIFDLPWQQIIKVKML